MKKNKRELFFWESQFNIRKGQLHTLPASVSRFNFRDSEITDEQVGWITARIKKVDQFDLDHSLITDEGMQYLARLEYIRELRLKGCRGVTQASIPFLDKMAGLELLHLGGTSVSLDDALGLGALQELKLLLLRSDEEEQIVREKAAQLQQLLPGCAININYQVFGK